MFTDNDINLLEKNFESITNDISAIRSEMFGPTAADIIHTNNIIHSFIKEHKRKIYGGYALDLLLKEKNSFLYDNDTIYNTPDIDFYSHEPVKDLIKLCNILNDAGFKYVLGKEAKHKDTYTITVNMKHYCDITYVPVNVNNKIPFRVINDYYVVSPIFMSIDYLRIITDPITSYWRIKKSVNRYNLLTKYYPLNNILKKKVQLNDKSICNEYMYSSETKNIPYSIQNSINDKITNILNNNKSCVSIGLSTIKYFLGQNNIYNSSFDNIFNYVIISTNYEEDVLSFSNILNNMTRSATIKIEEYRPYFQFTGISTHFKINNVTFLKIYSNDNKCIPYQKITDNRTPPDKYIQIGTYSLVLKSLLIELMINRTQNNHHLTTTYFKIVDYFVDIRNKYFEINAKENVFSDSLFKEFSIECVGKTLSPELERKQLIEYRKKNGKKLTITYEPKDNRKDPDDDTYYFTNCSGNKIINKQKNTNET